MFRPLLEEARFHDDYIDAAVVDWMLHEKNLCRLTEIETALQPLVSGYVTPFFDL